MLVGVLVAAIVTPPTASAVATAVPIATGLEGPAAFTVGGGSITYAERLTGEIRMINRATNADTSFFTVPDVATGREQGVLGVALHPRYPDVPYVYLYATRTVEGTPRNQILRVENVGGQGKNMAVIYSESTGVAHNGGRILFGPDGRLYVAVGDRGTPASAQTISSPYGKILRLNDDGTKPADNPFAGQRTFAYGLRNSFGFGFDPQSGRLWATDNGPECNDEVNRIIGGRNYGWGPTATCTTPPPAPDNTNQDGPDPQRPQRYFATSVAPTGLAFCDGCALGQATEGTMLYGTFNTRQIRRASLGPERFGIARDERIYTHPRSVLSVERGPNGTIYFSDFTGIYRLGLD